MPARLLFLAVLAILANCELAGSTFASVSGDGSLPTTHAPTPDGEECGVPAYSREPRDSSDEDQRSVIQEAQCYLACIERADLQRISTIAELNEGDDIAWPYYIITASGSRSCTSYQMLKECVRGCVTWATRTDISFNLCRRECDDDCELECDCESECGLGMCMPSYPNTQCGIRCTVGLCGPGCSQYNETVKHINNQDSADDGSSEGMSLLPPSFPPDLQVPPDNTTAGVYTVNLTQSSQMLSNGGTGFMFLFQVQDTSNGLRSVFLSKDPRQPIMLSDFACREVNVSFAVIDLSGVSLFSPATSLTIYGDGRRIPNPVQELSVSQRADMRYGFFGHAVLDISWSIPDNTRFLDGYALQVVSQNQGVTCHSGDAEYSFDDISMDDTSLTVMAMQRGQSLVMNCEYSIEVYSVGDDGESLASEEVYINADVPEVQMECVRLWDSQQYFTFIASIVLPVYATADQVVERFTVDGQVISTELPRTATISHLRITNDTLFPTVNQTMHNISLVGSRFLPLVPQRNEFYKFRVIANVVWGTSNVHVPATTSVICDIDATSPAPSLVENLILNSHSFLGNSQIQLDISWEPPAMVNGVLDGYEVCISPYALEPTRNPDQFSDSQCEQFPVEVVSTNLATSYISEESNCLYVQMRSRNTFVPGNWSVSYIIPTDTEDAIALECSSQWTDGKLEIESSWSVSNLSCNGVEQTEEMIIVKLLLVTGNGTYILNSSQFSFGDLYTMTYTDLPQRESSSDMYKVLLEVDWVDRLTLLEEVSTVSCSFTARIPKKVHPGVWAAVAVCLLTIILVALACCLVFLQCAVNIRRKKLLRRIAADACDSDPMYIIGAKRSNTVSATNALASPQTDDWEVLPAHVIVEDSLGEGAFGEVYRGVIKGPISNNRVRHTVDRSAICTQVAIKLLKKSAKGSERRDFLQEIEMMKKVTEGQNPHVVSMLGCVTVQEPLCLITEFIKYGDLLSYLKANMRLYSGAGNGLGDEDNPYLELGNVSAVDLISFAYQIASGMEYLSSLGIVHRDLASRNILVDEGKVLKITDFGMSRETDEVYVQQSKGRVPLKWMAIESIVAREFTSASDVWAYGVTLWEIGTLGGFPYPSIPNEELLSQLKRGYRMEKPENCSSEVYEIMLNCWNEDPKRRPGFSYLRSKFDSMLLEEGRDDYIILEIDADKNYYKMEPIIIDRTGHLPLAAQVKRKSRVSASVEETSFTDEKEKTLQSQLQVSPGATPLALHSPQANRRSHLTCSPNHEAPLARPLSALYPGTEQHTPQKQPVMNQYVDEPFKLTLPLVNGHTGGGGHSRRPSESVSEPGTQGREEAVPEIQITGTPDNYI